MCSTQRRMDSKNDSQIQNWSLTLAETSRQQWQTNLSFPRQLALFPPATLQLPASFTSHPGGTGTPSVVITNKPLILLEDSLMARVLGQGTSHDPYASFITRRCLPQPTQQKDESFTRMSVVPSRPSHTYEPLSEHVPYSSDEYKSGFYFQPGASNVIVSKGIGSTYSAKTITGLDHNRLKATDLQPTITLMEDQSVPDMLQYPPDEVISFSEDLTHKNGRESSLDDTVIPETPPPVPLFCKPDDTKRSEIESEPGHLLPVDEYSREEVMVEVNMQSAETLTQQSFGERILDTWSCGIVSLASKKPVTAQNMTAVEESPQTDTKLFNPLIFPAIEWKSKATTEAEIKPSDQLDLSNPPTPPPLPMNNSLKAKNNEKSRSEVQAVIEPNKSSKYPTLTSLNLAGLGLNASVVSSPGVPNDKANENRKSVILNLPTLPVLMNNTGSSSDILKLTACEEREYQMFEETDSEMEMPEQETVEETNECSAITEDQLNKDVKDSDLEVAQKDIQRPTTTDHQLDVMDENPEQNIILENSKDLPVLTQAAETKEDCYSSEKTVPTFEHADIIISQSDSTDLFLEPPLKKLKLSENNDVDTIEYSANAKPYETYQATNLIPENFHNLTELADNGVDTADQALPTESARLHSLVPSLVSCRVTQEDQGDSDPNDSQRFELPVQALESNLDAVLPLDLGSQQIALVPVESSPAMDNDQQSADDISKEANETSLPTHVEILVSNDEHMDTGNQETVPQNETSSSDTLKDDLPIASCTFDQQIVPETSPSMDESLGSFYHTETKVVTALPVSRAKTDDSLPATESSERKLYPQQERYLDQVTPEVTGAFQQQWSANAYSSGGPMKNSAKSSESTVTTRLNLKRPKLRLGLSKKQKCKSLHL